MDDLTPTNGSGGQDALLAELTRMNDRLDALTRQVAALSANQRALGELADEMGPIGREMMRAGTTQLADLERRGYFAFGEEVLGIVDRVVTTYSRDDVRALGDNVVRILDVVRAATQPEVLAIAEEATDAVSHPGSLEPVGVFGMLKAGNDPDVKRGMAVALEVLRQVGRGAQVARDPAGRAPDRRPPKRDSRLDRLAPKLGARASAPAPTARVAPRAAAAPAPVKAAPVASGPAPTIAGYTLTPDGFLADPKAWTREFATAMAQDQGIALGEEHWKVLDFARQDFLEHSVSPNIRRITVGTGLSTKDIYRLFPKAPGKTAARIAGVPKPAGCL